MQLLLFKVAGHGENRLFFVWLETLLKYSDQICQKSYLEVYYQFLQILKSRFMGFSCYSALLLELQ